MEKISYQRLLGFVLGAMLLSFSILFLEKDSNRIIYEGTFACDSYAKMQITKVVELQNEYNNKDIIGYLIVPGTSISEPVLQGSDNSFYLSHGIDKKKNMVGSVYLDYRMVINKEKNIIYSHNSSSLDVPFKDLEKYYDEKFYEKNKYIYLEDKENKWQYQIFSVFVETSDWSYMDNNLTKDKWLSHLKKLKSKSWYETGGKLSEDDEILILQTCSHHKKYKKYKNKYLLVCAKKIK